MKKIVVLLFLCSILHAQEWTEERPDWLTDDNVIFLARQAFNVHYIICKNKNVDYNTVDTMIETKYTNSTVPSKALNIILNTANEIAYYILSDDYVYIIIRSYDIEGLYYKLLLCKSWLSLTRGGCYEY